MKETRLYPDIDLGISSLLISKLEPYTKYNFTIQVSFNKTKYWSDATASADSCETRVSGKASAFYPRVGYIYHTDTKKFQTIWGELVNQKEKQWHPASTTYCSSLTVRIPRIVMRIMLIWYRIQLICLFRIIRFSPFLCSRNTASSGHIFQQWATLKLPTLL